MNSSCSEGASRNETTQLIWSIRDSPKNPNEIYGYLCATVALLILTFGAPLNLLIIATVLWKKLYKSAMVIPMISLSLSNLLLCLLVLPFIIISGYSMEFLFGPSDYVRCKVCTIGIVNITLPLASIFSLAVMAIGRVLYLKKPFHHDAIMTPFRVFATLVTLWSLCSIASLPPLLGFGSVYFSKYVATCVPAGFGTGNISSIMYYNVILITLALIGVVITLVMYVWIGCIAQSYMLKHPKRFALLHNESVRDLTAQYDSDSEEKLDTSLKKLLRKKQIRVVLVLIGIISANVITWLPMIVLAMVPLTTLSSGIPGTVYSIAYMCYLLQVIVHPLVQMFLVYELKETAVKLWKSFTTKIFKQEVKQ